MIWSIVADESIWEKGEKGVVFVALHNASPCDLTGYEFIIGKLSKMISELGHLVAWQAGTEPLNEVSVILSLNVDGVDFILVEMSVIFFWKFNVFAIFAKIDLNCILSKLIQKLFDSLPLFSS